MARKGTSNSTNNNAEKSTSGKSKNQDAHNDTVAQEDQGLSGRGWHGDPERHAEAGRKGGAKVSQDRAHMAEIGRRGGTKVSQDRAHMAEIGRRGGSKVSENRNHMSEIGKKGGESR